MPYVMSHVLRLLRDFLDLLDFLKVCYRLVKIVLDLLDLVKDFLEPTNIDILVRVLLETC